MNVAVTGCFGFVGSHIVERLAEAGHSISLLDLPYWDLAGPPHGHNGPWLPQHIDAIVHCAAIPDVRGVDEDRLWDVNVNGTRRLLQHLPPSCRTIVFISSMCVYGHDTDGRPLAPVSLYGASKLAGEALCSAWAAQAPGRRWVALRPCAIYGARYARGHVRDFVERYRRDGKVTAFDDGSQVKMGIAAGDVAEAVAHLLTRSSASGAFNIAAAPWGWRDTAREMGIAAQWTIAAMC